MSRRNALIGFTEAELGFVVAAVVAFTAAAEMPATRPSNFSSPRILCPHGKQFRWRST